MNAINSTAAMFSAAEAMNFMIRKAAEKGEKVTVQEIMQEIVANPTGNTANYFKQLLTTGYDVAMEWAK